VATAGRWGRGDLTAHLALVVAAFFFGTTFVPVRDAVLDVEPVPFIAVRFLVAAAVVWPFARGRPRPPGAVAAGVACGAALAVGFVLQTVGLQYTTPSASAFITYLLVVMVPILSAVLLRRRPQPLTLVGVVLATFGLFLLTGADLSLGRGEVLTVGCAVAFALHIVLLAELAPRFDSVVLNVVQLAVVGVACFVPGLVAGGYGFTARAALAAVYTALAASALAFGLMVWAQRRVGPTRAALLLTLEPVFAAAAGYLAGDRLGGVGLVGGVVILAGILVAELGPAAPAGVVRKEQERKFLA
jgi:drug/metabolite transporter (DMT)-like permease